jgi:hypothetical protein
VGRLVAWVAWGSIVYNEALFLVFKQTQPKTDFLRSARAEVVSTGVF